MNDLKSLIEQMEVALSNVPREISAYRVATYKSGPRLISATYQRCFEGINLVWKIKPDPRSKVKLQPPNWPWYWSGFSGFNYHIASTPEKAWKLFLDVQNNECANGMEELRNIERIIRIGNRRSKMKIVDDGKTTGGTHE